MLTRRECTEGCETARTTTLCASRRTISRPAASPRCADRTSSACTGRGAATPSRTTVAPGVPSCAARPVTQRRRPRPVTAARSPGMVAVGSMRTAGTSPSNSTVSSTTASPRRGEPVHSAAPTITVPVSSRISGTRRATPVRACRAVRQLGACPTSMSSRSARSNRVSTEARSASEPTTMTLRQLVMSSMLTAASVRAADAASDGRRTARPRHPLWSTRLLGSAGIGWVTGWTEHLGR